MSVVTSCTNLSATPEELKITAKALRCTIINYFPCVGIKAIIDASPLFRSKKEEFMPQESESGDEEDIVHELIHWVVEDDSDEAELIQELITILTKSLDHCDEPQKHKLQTIVDVLSGKTFKELSNEDVHHALGILYQKKYISKKSYQQAIKSDDSISASLEMLKGLRIEKHDWPFVFMGALNLKRSLTKQDALLARAQSSQNEDAPKKSLTTDTKLGDFAGVQQNTNVEERDPSHTVKATITATEVLPSNFSESTEAEDEAVGDTEQKEVLGTTLSSTARANEAGPLRPLYRGDWVTSMLSCTSDTILTRMQYSELENAQKESQSSVGVSRELAGISSMEEEQRAEESMKSAPQLSSKFSELKEGNDNIETSLPQILSSQNKGAHEENVILDMNSRELAEVLQGKAVKENDAEDKAIATPMTSENLSSKFSQMKEAHEKENTHKENLIPTEVPRESTEVKQSTAVEVGSVGEEQKAIEVLKSAPKLSSTFSIWKATVDKVTQKSTSRLTDFSDESSDDDNEAEEMEGHQDLELREYQKELAEKALLGHNTIICAPTGCGKTRVATHIILKHLQEGNKVKSKRKVAFLARTVPLVMQQFKSLKKYLPPKFQIENLTGESDYSGSLHKIINAYDVFVMTPRILENHVKGKNPDLTGGLSAFSLLVFDECHHTRKGEAYCTLMLTYLQRKHNKKGMNSSDLPQVVGLTASLGIEKAKNPKEAKANILKICGNLDADNISVVEKNEEELAELVPVPTEECVRLHERDDSEAVKKIIDTMQTLEEYAEKQVNEINDENITKTFNKKPHTNKKSQQYSNWMITVQKQTNSIKGTGDSHNANHLRALMVIGEHLKAYNVAVNTIDLVRLKDVLSDLDKAFRAYIDSKDKLTKAEKFCLQSYQELKEELVELDKKTKGSGNPSLTQLRKTIKKYLIDREEEQGKSHKQKGLSRGMIFVRTRALAHALVSWLQWLRGQRGQFAAINAEVLTGTAAKEEEGGMTETRQEEVIAAFKSGKTRVLVATSVGEEGLDIPECNLVIKYNHVGNEVTTVQTRGRSRSKGGKSVLLAFDDIYKKELINQHDADLMKKAVKEVAKMTAKDIAGVNMRHQEERVMEDKIDRATKRKAKVQCKVEKKFKLICKHCRHMEVLSEDIRIISDSHHIVIKRGFLDSVSTRESESWGIIGQSLSYGKVICPGTPEEALCDKKLGSVIIFKDIPFVVLSVANFNFEVEGKDKYEQYKNWKDVPYNVKAFEWKQDIKQYCPDLLDSSDDESEDSDVPKRSEASFFKQTIETEGARDMIVNVAAEMVNREVETSVTDPKGVSDSASQSVTEPKAVAHTQGLCHANDYRPMARAKARDSGFQSEAQAPRASGSNLDSNTNIKEAIGLQKVNRLTPREEVADSSQTDSSLKLSQERKDADNHLDLAEKQLDTNSLSECISDFVPLPSESMQGSSFSAPLFSKEDSDAD